MSSKTRSRAVGAIAAQGSQAAASFALQFSAARFLGLDGLGQFAILYGMLVLATAVCSGFVGDSLTVLERGRATVRAGLEWWLAVIVIGSGALCALGTGLTGFVSPAEALTFGVATGVFLVEDTIRRLLMAVLHFWRIVAVDLVAGVVALAVIVAAVLSNRFSLTMLLVGLAFGQTAALIVGWRLLPPSERTVVVMRAPALGEVAAYGAWRAMQQAVRAATLALVRVICLLVATEAAVGELEAARIYMAPAVLAVGGVSSYLFASYALSTDVSIRQLVSLADRAVTKLIVGVLAFGLVGLALVPVLGSLLTGGEYEISAVAVAGWAAYAAAIAGVTPYGQLASVRGRQVAVFWWRVADSMASLVGIFVIVGVTESVQWAPLIMASCSLLGGLAIRELVIKRGLVLDADLSEGSTQR